MAYRNAGKRGYKLFLSVIAAVLVISSPAMAQPKFDKTIAKAAADQVAKKLGTLRDGFNLDEKLVLVPGTSLSNKRVRDTLNTRGISRVKPINYQPRVRYQHHYDQVAKTNVRVVYTGTIIDN